MQGDRKSSATASITRTSYESLPYFVATLSQPVYWARELSLKSRTNCDHRTLHLKSSEQTNENFRFDFPFVAGLRDSRSKRCDTTWVLRECLDNNGYRRVFLMKYLLSDSKLVAASQLYIQKWANAIISRNNSNRNHVNLAVQMENQNKVLVLVLLRCGLPFYIVYGTTYNVKLLRSALNKF